MVQVQILSCSIQNSKVKTEYNSVPNLRKAKLGQILSKGMIKNYCLVVKSKLSHYFLKKKVLLPVLISEKVYIKDNVSFLEQKKLRNSDLSFDY